MRNTTSQDKALLVPNINQTETEKPSYGGIKKKKKNQ